MNSVGVEMRSGLRADTTNQLGYTRSDLDALTRWLVVFMLVTAFIHKRMTKQPGIFTHVTVYAQGMHCTSTTHLHLLQAKSSTQQHPREASVTSVRPAQHAC